MNNVQQYLLDQQVSYILHEHPPVYTCEEAQKYCSGIPGLSCKNLFLRNKKAQRYFLLVLASHKRADLKKISDIIGATRLSFANSQELQEILHLTPGAVSPFGLINDTDHSVECIIDREVYESDIVSFHPNINTATLELSKDMFHKFLETIESNVSVIDF